MEIERKWMVDGWPPLDEAALPLLYTEYQEQGYIHVNAPIVRIRLEARVAEAPESDREKSSAPVTDLVQSRVKDEDSKYVLCIKSAGYLAREEVEIEMGKDHFSRLAMQLAGPLIRKVRRVYRLEEGLCLEVNLVDEGLPTEFMYAEVEFGSEEQARSWEPAACGLGDYLMDDVTEKPGQSMSAYWDRTRLNSPG